MKFHVLRWVIAGAVAAVAVAAIGSAVIALRRGWMLADEENELFPPEPDGEPGPSDPAGTDEDAIVSAATDR